MKKLILALSIAALAAGFGPAAQADPGNGCVIELVGGEADTGATCTYVATGPATFIAATPNHWSITLHRGEDMIIEGPSSGNLEFPSTGTVPSEAGDTVIVSIGPDDASPAPVSGWIGALIVVETE